MVVASLQDIAFLAEGKRSKVSFDKVKARKEASAAPVDVTARA
jgi:hypothetical protein